MVKWHNKIYTYYVPLPEGVNEAVMSCIDGYTIYIDETLDEEQKKKEKATTHWTKTRIMSKTRSKSSIPITRKV